MLRYVAIRIMIVAVIGLLSCSFVAIFQHNVKRMLAYSSVAQIGYILMGVGLATKTGLTASLLHLFNHALMKAGLFMAMGCFFYRIASVRLDDLRGVGHRMPWTFAAFVLGGLSLIGVPLTVGFVSKWYLVLASLEQGLWPLAAVILFGSLLAIVYVWRVVEVAWFERPSPRAAEAREAPLVMLVPTWILILGNLFFGIQTDLTVGVAELAAQILTEDLHHRTGLGRTVHTQPMHRERQLAIPTLANHNHILCACPRSQQHT